MRSRFWGPPRLGDREVDRPPSSSWLYQALCLARVCLLRTTRVATSEAAPSEPAASGFKLVVAVPSSTKQTASGKTPELVLASPGQAREAGMVWSRADTVIRIVAAGRGPSE